MNFTRRERFGEHQSKSYLRSVLTVSGYCELTMEVLLVDIRFLLRIAEIVRAVPSILPTKMSKSILAEKVASLGSIPHQARLALTRAITPDFRPHRQPNCLRLQREHQMWLRQRRPLWRYPWKRRRPQPACAEVRCHAL